MASLKHVLVIGCPALKAVLVDMLDLLVYSSCRFIIQASHCIRWLLLAWPCILLLRTMVGCVADVCP